MKKSFTKATRLALVAATLAVFLFSCANPLQNQSLSPDGTDSRALVSPTQIDISNYKYVLDLGNTAGIDALKLDRIPVLGDVIGPVTITKLWYEGPSGTLLETGAADKVVGFDFTSTKTIYMVYVKGANGGYQYDYRPAGVAADTELHTILNPNGKFAAISHIDFAWDATGGSTNTGGNGGSNPPVIPTYSISGAVFHDLNANGVLDSGETGLAGVAVTLGSSSDTTDANGLYSFDGLLAGTYTVTANGLSGFYPTPYADHAGLTSSTNVAVGPSAAEINFGFSYETVKGVVFYDANRDDTYQAGEPLLEGFTVRLGEASAVTGANGAYTFTNLRGDTAYTVTADGKEGFLHSVLASRTVTPALSVPALADFGFVVDYAWIPGKLANGFTIGYWKNNIDKAIANKTNGIQVSRATLLGYQATLSTFLLAPLNITSLADASAKLSATGSDPKLLLAKQLMGSEFNFASGAFIGGNELVTKYFLFDGEYMLAAVAANPGAFSSTQLLAQKDRYDAYNNSHGGAVLF